MAEIIVPLNDPTAVVIYSKRVFQHAIRATTAAKLAAVGLNADSQDNFVQLFDEASKGPGDTIKYDLVPNIVGPGVLGDSPIGGQEQAWTALQDTLLINQQRQAELLKGRMSQQRVPYSMRDSARTTLANWWKQTFNIGLMNQLGGNTAQTDVSYTGMNAAIAPDSNHWIFAGTATTEATLTSAMPFSRQIIPRSSPRRRAISPSRSSPSTSRASRSPACSSSIHSRSRLSRSTTPRANGAISTRPPSPAVRSPGTRFSPAPSA